MMVRDVRQWLPCCKDLKATEGTLEKESSVGSGSSSGFFRDWRYYIPEITLAKPIVVLRGDVPRIKDFKVSIEEIAGND